MIYKPYYSIEIYYISKELNLKQSQLFNFSLAFGCILAEWSEKFEIIFDFVFINYSL